MGFKTLLLFTCIPVLLLPAVSSAQLPLSRHYNVQDYQAGDRNWKVIQDADGFMHVANQQGLLTYDGARWRLLRLPGRTVRALATDAHGRLFAGTLNDVGIIQTTETGQTEFYSLKPYMPDSGRSLKTVFELTATSTAVFAETQTMVLLINTNDPSLPIRTFTFDEYLVGTFNIHNNVYVVGTDHIFVYREGNFVKLRPTAIDSGEIFTLTAIGLHGILAYTDDNRIWLFEQGFSDTPRIWNTALQQYIDDQSVDLYFGTGQRPVDHTIGGNASFFVIPSVNRGVLLTDVRGNLLQHLTSDDILASNTVYHSYVDRQDNIWLATNKGITKILYDVPLRKVAGPQNQLPPVLSLTGSPNGFFAGTNHGIYHLGHDQTTFSFISGTASQIWDIKAWNNGFLAAGGNDGLYFIKEQRVYHTYPTKTALMSVTASSRDGEILFAGLYNGFEILRHSSSGFELLAEFPQVDATVRTMVFDDVSSTLWLGTDFDGIYRLVFTQDEHGKLEYGSPNITHYQSNGELAFSEHNQVYNTPLGVRFTGVGAIYRFDEKSEKMIPDNSSWTKNTGAYPRLIDDRTNRIWIANRQIVLSDLQQNTADSLLLRGISGTINDVYSIDENTAWIATNNGLYYLNLDNTHYAHAAPVYYRSIFAGGFNQPLPQPQQAENRQVWPYSATPAYVEIASPNFLMEEQMLYRYKVEGLHTNWQPWTNHSHYNFGHLNEGNYVFKAEVLDIFGNRQLILPLEFEVNPPWFRTYWAYILYGSVLFLLVWGLIRYNNYRLIKRNEYLSSLVDSRTDEISRQNDVLKKQANELREANDIKSEFLNMAVHDLRNPLGVIAGLTDLLQTEENDSKTVQEYLLQIQRVTNRMMRRINRILTDSKINNVANNENLQKVNITSVVREVTQHNRVLASRKQQKLITKFDDSLHVMGNYDLLTDLIENILNNAIKYAPPGSVIRITAYAISEQRADYIDISIQDEGPGISHEHQSVIFDEYYTTGLQPTGNERSTGLGLYIVKKIVDAHHGTIEIISDPELEPGTTVRILLPAYNA